MPEFPVQITTAAYSGTEPCTRCGQRVSNGFRVVGTKGPEVARWLILCAPCYRRFQRTLQRVTGVGS
jgi:hypothetical protein